MAAYSNRKNKHCHRIIERPKRRVWSNGMMTRQKCLSLVESRNSPPSISLEFLQMALVLLNCEKQKRKKGGEIMKSLKTNLSMLLVFGVLGTSGAALAASVEVEGQLAPGGYCHEKFPAMTGRSLGDNQPQLKQSTTGDVIDYYGPCGEDPTGKDQIATQKLEHYHQMEGSRGGEIGRF
jgi:hypothetical protein